MNVLPSKHLRLNKFYITDQSVLTRFPEGKQRVLLDKHSVDMEYEVFRSAEKDHEFEFLVNLNIKCNLEEKPGYLISLGVVGEFTLYRGEKMNSKVESAYVLGSALPLIINSARVHLLQITSNFPFGSYTLPIIDMGSLFKAKNKAERENGN